MKPAKIVCPHCDKTVKINLRGCQSTHVQEVGIEDGSEVLSKPKLNTLSWSQYECSACCKELRFYGTGEYVTEDNIAEFIEEFGI